MTHPIKAAITVGEPNWTPLELLLPASELENFMYMGRAGEIELYKHWLTRRYLNISADGQRFYRYSDETYVESHSFGDLEIRSVGIAVEPLAVGTDVEITAREPVLIQLDLPRSAHVHEVFKLASRKDQFKRTPVRLADCDREFDGLRHGLNPPATGGTPTCECLQPTQQTADVTFLIASSNRCGRCSTSPARL